MIEYFFRMAVSLFSFSQDDLKVVNGSGEINSKANSDFKVLINKRKGKRGTATKTVNYVHANLSSLNASECENSLLKLKQLLADLDKVDNEVIALAITREIYSDEVLAHQLEINEMYSDKITSAIISIEHVIKSRGDSPPASGDSTVTKAKLPKVELPTFSGAAEEYERFVATFEAIIDKHTLSSYEKYVYFKGQLSGPPKILIDSLPLDNLTYEAAKKLLNEAFCDKTAQQFRVIDKLVNLKLTNDGDSFAWISSVYTIIDQVQNLSIDVSTILQYFVWNSLNNRFKQHLIAITNNSKPTLKEIQDNLFEANSRYLAQNEQFNKSRSNLKVTPVTPKTSSTALATNIPNNKPLKYKPCKLCYTDNSSSEHSLSRCPVYPNSTDKISRLLQLNGCVKCSSLNHVVADCMTKLDSRCASCNSWHLEILCDRKSKQSTVKKENKGKEGMPNAKGNGKMTSKVKVKECENGLATGTLDSSSDIILPIMTGKLEKNDVKSVPIMLDTGSQLSFINSKLAEQCKFKVLKTNLSIDINGFNSTTRYNTKSVLVEIIVGTKIAEFEAICIPKVRTNVNFYGLQELVKLFEHKGYNMASKDIDKCENEVCVLMGIDVLHVLQLKEVSFGYGDSMSAYLDSLFGVILMGSISTMKENIEYLPVVSLNSESCINVYTGYESLNESDLSIKNECKCDSHVFELFCSSLNSHSTMVDLKGEIVEDELLQTTTQALDEKCNSFLNKEEYVAESSISNLNIDLCEFMIENTVRDSDTGRLLVPLPWNPKVKHLMDDNFKLAKKILDHNIKKLKRDETKLVQYNDVIAKQESEKIIERIPDLETFLKENPKGISFLAHNGVFRPDRQSTKCRIVFLSNLNSSNHLLSHNQCSLPGPNLNHKMSTAFTLLRFDKYLLTFDLKQAFLQLMLNPEDTNKLLFLWYTDVMREAKSLVAYRFLRLPFGLRFSPFVLMVALYIILMNSDDTGDTRQFKRDLYELAYMDNLAWTSNDERALVAAYHNSVDIFDDFKFKLQQFNTNYLDLQIKIDEEMDDISDSSCKLFGMLWHKSTDKLSIRTFDLSVDANTKRLILSTLHTIFDPFGLCLPLLNRARLFLHKLQLNKELKWDTPLPTNLQKEWTNIVRQISTNPVIEIDRSFGHRNDMYELICFTDASKSLYGCVIYLKCVSTGKVTFLMAKNKVINEQLSSKTMPVLELVGMNFGVHSLMDVYNELQNTLRPINISKLKLFTDSTISLSWIEALVSRLDKMQGKGVFIMNKLESIRKLCQTHQVEFGYIPGLDNPANWTTREVSGRILLKTCFYSGPSNVQIEERCIGVLVPNPIEQISDTASISTSLPTQVTEPLFPLDRYSSFSRAVNVIKTCFKYINKLKLRVQNRGSKQVSVTECSNNSIYEKSCLYLLRQSQKESFPELFIYFEGRSKKLKDIPELATRLNLFIDDTGIIRVKSKLHNLKASFQERYPILLSRSSPITKAVIWDLHVKKKHCGIYGLLNDLRKEFWILQYYSAVKEVIKHCVWCKRLNARTIKTNVNAYKEYRIDPDSIPFRDIMIDHMGPFSIKTCDKVEKVWVLIATCLFSRAVSLNICMSLDTSSFLRAFQMHVLKCGLPKLILSDPGSSIVSGVNVIVDFLNDFETKNYLEANGISKVKFETYPSGASWLGGLVETMVKQCKKLLNTSIHKRILDYQDFEYVILETECLINKRPIALKDHLRDVNSDSLALTPEMIVKGYSTTILNVIPYLQPNPDDFKDKLWTVDNGKCIGKMGILVKKYEKLKRIRENIQDKYHNEFLYTLISQATDRKNRYIPTNHNKLDIGDLVCIKQPLSKPLQYPLAVVRSVRENDLGETVSAQVMKDNRQIVHKHASDLILLMKTCQEFDEDHKDNNTDSLEIRHLPGRKAKDKAMQRIADFAEL